MMDPIAAAPAAVVVPRRSPLFCILSLSFVSATTAHSPVAFVAPSVKMSPSAAISSKSSSTLSSSSSSDASATSSAVAEACALVSNPPPTKTAAGVLFDVDGTLADSWRLGYDATLVVLRNNDLGHVEMNEEIYHAHCVYATPERLARHAGLRPGAGDDEEFERVGEELGRQFDEHYVALVSQKTAGFYDGMADILRNLPDETKLGALTNACAAYGHAVLEANCPVKSSGEDEDGDTEAKFALYDRFATIHGADSVPAPKPSALGLLQCASELGLNPKDCIYVGDAPGDGKAAKAAGMIAVGVLWGSNSEEKMRGAETFDYLCKNVDELRALLPQK